ncbi:MAG: RimK family alpha-L-glutamate ligase [Actinomycetota bacterium]
MIALVTAAVSRDLDEDLPILGAALDRAGTQFHFVNWHDDVDWSQYSAVFLRSPWDYHLRRDEFLAWLRNASRVTRVFNPFEIVEWNSDKRYLGDLVAAGIPVVPTRFIASAEESLVRDVLDEFGNDVVVKPSISAGSHDTSRYRDASLAIPDVINHVARIVAAGAVAMVQPYEAGIDERGETGMVWLNGELSHAFRKGAILAVEPDMGNGLYAAEDIASRTASNEEIALGESIMDFLRSRFGEAPLYARVDVIPDEAGHPQLMELELVEPSFFLAYAPGADDRVASAFTNAQR